MGLTLPPARRERTCSRLSCVRYLKRKERERLLLVAVLVSMNFSFSTAPNKDATANIVLVGSTGCGKSTFGNWIYDFGRKELFVPGHTPNPCTQNVVSKQVTVHGDKPLIPENEKSATAIKLNLIDTPGLNEKDAEKDLEHMCDLLKTVHQLKTISCVVLCVPWSTRLDEQTINTLKYYQRLFRPVFSAGNAVIVMTKVDSNSFGMWNADEWELRMEENRAAISAVLDFQIQNIFAVNSCFPKRKLAKVIDPTHPGLLNFPVKKNLMAASLLARLHFITITSQLRPISIEGHLFPLPPCMETICLHELRIIEGRLNQLQATLTAEDEIKGLYMGKEIDLRREIDRINQDISANVSMQNEKKEIQHTPAQTAYGEEILFRGKIKPLLFDCPLNNYQVEAVKYHCDFEDKGAAGNSTIRTFKPLPDFVTILSKEVPESGGFSARWFLRLQLAYSGMEYFKTAIDKLELEKAKLEVEKVKKESDLRQTEAEHREKIAKYEAHQAMKIELEKQKQLFTNNFFELGMIPNLIDKLKASARK